MQSGQDILPVGRWAVIAASKPCLMLSGLCIAAVALAVNHPLAAETSVRPVVRWSVATTVIIQLLAAFLVLAGAYRRTALIASAVCLSATVGLTIWHLSVEAAEPIAAFGLKLLTTSSLNLLVAGLVVLVYLATRQLDRALGRMPTRSRSTGSRFRVSVAVCLWLIVATCCALDTLRPHLAPVDPQDLVGSVEESQASADGSFHNFGYVELGSTHSWTFNIRNDSEKVLDVRRATSECACIHVRETPSTIDPGGQAPLRLELVAPKQPVRYDERVLVRFQDPRVPPAVLRVTAHVGLPLEAQPPAVDLGTLIEGQESHTDIVLVNHGRDPVRLLYSTSTVPGCFAAVPRAAVEPGRQTRLRLVLKAPAGTGKEVQGVIRVQTDCSHQRQVQLPLIFRVAQEHAMVQAP